MSNHPVPPHPHIHFLLIFALKANFFGHLLPCLSLFQSPFRMYRKEGFPSLWEVRAPSFFPAHAAPPPPSPLRDCFVAACLTFLPWIPKARHICPIHPTFLSSSKVLGEWKVHNKYLRKPRERLCRDMSWNRGREWGGRVKGSEGRRGILPWG